MTQVEQDGFTNLKTWRLHWDRQLYKALEHQYQVRSIVTHRFEMNAADPACKVKLFRPMKLTIQAG